MWNPNDNGLDELILLFSKNNYSEDSFKTQSFIKEINAKKFNNEIVRYLVYILGGNEISTEIKMESAFILQLLIKDQTFIFSDSCIDYLECNLASFLIEKPNEMQSRIKELIKSYIKYRGLNNWVDILNSLLNNFNAATCNQEFQQNILDLLNIILENCSEVLIKNSQDMKLNSCISKINHILVEFIKKYESIDKIREEEITLITVLIEYVSLMIKNYADIAKNYSKKFIDIFLKFEDSDNINLRTKISICFLDLLKNEKELLFENYEYIFCFFFDNYRLENYYMNLSASEFFLFLIENYGNEFKSIEEGNAKDLAITNLKDSVEKDNPQNNPTNYLSVYFEKNLKEILPYILHYMKISRIEIEVVESESNSGNNSTSSSNSFNYQNKNKSNINIENLDINNDVDYLDFYVYNNYWTLRKCSSKLLDKISCKYPKLTLSILKPFLENDMQCEDWIKKERSILALGAIAIGSYEFLKPHLPNLLSYIVYELQNANKLIRAITCWTLSRYTNFIINDNNSENSDNLFKEYLIEIQKRFLDLEEIVQEASSCAFSILMKSNKDKIVPFLPDIIKIVSTIFDRYDETNILILHDISVILTKYYKEEFEKLEVVEHLVKSIVKNFRDKITKKDIINVTYLIDILPALFKSNGFNINNHIEEILLLTFEIIDVFYLQYFSQKKNLSIMEKDIINKSLDLLSVIYSLAPQKMLEFKLKNKIVENIFKLLEIDDNYVKHFVIAIIGEIAKIDSQIFMNYIRMIASILINNLDLNDCNKLDSIEIDKLSVCNNSCWTIGLLALSYPKLIVEFFPAIMKKLISILTHSKLNKSLAQNISICIGRCSLVAPYIISSYLDEFLKQFCISLRNIKDSKEKKEAFTGLCKGILFNPNGVINHFAFLCDAICLYDDAPIELENLFQNLIFSYKNTLKEKWFDYFSMFPDKLKKKMTERFISN